MFFWGPADAVLPTSAAPAGTFVDGTNFDYFALGFAGADGAADESCFFVGVVPDSYGAGTVFFRIYWVPAAGAPASENCSWDVSVLGRIDDEVFDTAASETQTVNDVVTAAGDLQVASTTAASVTLAAGDFLVIKLNRDYDEANGGTGLGEDANFVGLQMLES